MILHSINNIHIIGSAIPTIHNDWSSLKKLDGNTKISNNIYRKTWCSNSPEDIVSTGTFGENSIIPITIANNVGLTYIHGSIVKNSNVRDHLKSGNEEHVIVDITIDWLNDKVSGLYQIIRYDGNIYSKTTNSFTGGGIFKGTISDIQTTNNIQGLTRQDPVFLIEGRNIVALPLFGILSSFTYMLSNYIYKEEELLKYTSDMQNTVYTEFNIDTLNTLRTAYENLRISYDNLLNKLENIGIVV